MVTRVVRVLAWAELTVTLGRLAALLVVLLVLLVLALPATRAFAAALAWEDWSAARALANELPGI